MRLIEVLVSLVHNSVNTTEPIIKGKKLKNTLKHTCRFLNDKDV